MSRNGNVRVPTGIMEIRRSKQTFKTGRIFVLIAVKKA